MKKILLLCLVGMGILLGTSFSTNAQNLGDLIDNLGSGITFGYNVSNKISITGITTEKVSISSPVITSQGTRITKYTLMYSEYPLADILEKTDLLSQTKEKTIELTGSESTFTIELGTTESIDPTKKYFIFVVPKDSAGNLGEVSNELRFTLASKNFGEGTTTGSLSTLTTSDTSDTHNAAGADMTLANISHTVQGNSITLSWIAVQGSTNIQINVMKPGSTSFVGIGNIGMSSQTFKYVADQNGEYIFQFIPDNNGKQVNYSMTFSNGNNPNPNPTPQIKKVPNTGATENIVAVVIIAGFFYLLYKKNFKKAK